jgi:nicotinamide-nucleotide amidase
MIKASIITIGDELLIGQVIDTNSAWMAQQLNKAGISLAKRVAVGDNREAIINALDEESKNADVILITGGLGPTADDITKPLLCEYFSGRLVVNEDALNNVIYLIETVHKRVMTDRNRKQAEVPDNCRVLQNKRGTAPGMWFEKDGKIFVSMPGVPHEMKGMMDDDVIPALLQKFSMPFITHRTMITFGIGESMIADRIVDFETALPPHIKLAYLPNYGLVRLRLSTTGSNETETNTEIEGYFKTLQNLLADVIITDIDGSYRR